MVYIYDILLNFTDTEKIYEFFEWDFNDSIDHIKRMGLFRVSTKMMEDLVHHNVTVLPSFLDSIKNKTEVFQNKRITYLDYACLFTDGKCALAVEFDEHGNSIYMSHLLVDEEEEVLEVSDQLSIMNIQYEIIKDKHNSLYLTRREEQIQKYLIRELKSSYSNHNLDKIKYLYGECFNDFDSDYKVMYDSLIKSVSEKLDENHLKLYNILKLSHTKKQV